MKKNQGFTLVELVIVIVILGILAITAAPKFLNLSGDAKASTLKALKGSIESANALVYSKALLQGKEKTATATLTSPAINVVYGYPKAATADLALMLELSTDEWTVDGTSLVGKVVITPKPVVYTATVADACQLTYSESTGPGVKPVVLLETNGC